MASAPSPLPFSSSPASGPEQSALRAEDRERLEALSTDACQDDKEPLRALLQEGRDILGVQNGHLAQIHPGRGTHTVVALAGACSPLREGAVHDLSSTYCRSIIAANDLVSLHDAAQTGWADDLAYQTFGFDCYLGTRVLVNGRLYGTVCFAAPEARPDPFSAADHALVREIARRTGRCLHARPSSDPQAEQDRSLDFLRRVQEVSKVGGWEIDLPSGELRWTEATYDLFDLSLDYAPDVDSAISFFAEAAQSTLRAALDRCIDEGVPYDLELPLITDEGTRRWVRTRGVPRIENGTVSRITGTIQDLTDVTDETETRRALRNERDRFETLFQNLPTPVARCRVEDDATPIAAVNAAFEDVFGVSGSVEGTDINELLVPGAKQEHAQHLTERALEDGTLQVEVERLTPEGLRDFRLQVAGRTQPDAPPEVYAIYTDITELKERERTIRSERDLLNRVFETSPTAIVIFDREGRFVRASDRAQEILGMDESEVTERTYNDPAWHITTADGQPVPDHALPFHRVKERREPLLGAEHTIQWPDGTRRLLSVSGAPLHTADGSFMGAVFHLDDITEQRRTQLSLADSEQRFRGVFENAALGIALLGDAGQFLDVNPALASMVEREPDDLRGEHFEVVTHADDVVRDKQQYARLMQGDLDVYQLEKRYRRKSGSSFWGHLTVSRLDGPGAVRAVGMVEDIDARKQQRDELRTFRAAIEHAHEAVFILDGEPRDAPGPPITYANPRVEPLTGYAPSDVTGRPFPVLFGSDTESRLPRDLWSQLQAGNRHEGEALAYRKDGSPFVTRWNIAPVRDEDRTIVHWVAVLRDVTEQRQMDRRLLEVQDEERRRIDQEMHDEMGGLLTTLQMTVELARLEARKGPVAPDRFDEIEDLVSDISSVTRTISRRLHPRALDEHGLSAALSSLVSDFENRHGLEIRFDNALEDEPSLPSLVELTAYRVVQEALVNVFRHANTDAVQVRAAATPPDLCLHVIDEGSGFDPTAPPKDDAYGLHGIRERVERLNGTLNIDSAEGAGTHLTVRLPLSISYPSPA